MRTHGALQGNAGRDQAGSTCFGICTIGSRQKIDYEAETLIRCLSRYLCHRQSIPSGPQSCTRLHLSQTASSIWDPPHLTRLRARHRFSACMHVWCLFFFFFQARPHDSQHPNIFLCSSAIILPSLSCNSSAVLYTSPAYMRQCTWMLGVGKQDWFLSSQSGHYRFFGNMFIRAYDKWRFSVKL